MNSSKNYTSFIETIQTLGCIGWVKGQGLQREAYSDAFFQARDWLQKRMEDIGLEVRVDKVGNLFGRFSGKSDSIILTGSHLDSVHNGGKYDGAVGVVAGLEVLRRLKENNYQSHNSLEVVAFAAEEAGPLDGVFGSRCFSGRFPVEKNETIKHYGFSKQDIIESVGDLAKYRAFLELHVEQGPSLDCRNLPIGIPTGIAAIKRYMISFFGEMNHAGTTPMATRKDSLRAAADLIHKWFLWMDQQKNDLNCNIGIINVTPGFASVIPNKAEFCLELRSQSDDILEQAENELYKLLKDVARCRTSVKLIGYKEGGKMNKNLQKIIASACDKNKMEYIYMTSGASHDANPLSFVIPTGMIFIPSKNGISHAKGEFTSVKDMINGFKVLYDTIVMLDNNFSE